MVTTLLLLPAPSLSIGSGPSTPRSASHRNEVSGSAGMAYRHVIHSTIPERQKFNSDLASTLTKSLQTMLTHASSEGGRSAVPLITNAQSISPFPIKITVKVGGVEVA